MFKTILAAIAVFASTSVDELLILILLFSRRKARENARAIAAGLFSGIAILTAASLVAARLLRFVPEPWMIGLLGLVPLALGILHIFGRAEDPEEEAEEASRALSRRGRRLVRSMTLVTLAQGGDNLGVYIPYFAALDLAHTLAALGVFIACAAALSIAGYRFSTKSRLARTLSRYERILVPAVFIILGVWLLVENGSIAQLVRIF